MKSFYLKLLCTIFSFLILLILFGEKGIYAKYIYIFVCVYSIEKKEYVYRWCLGKHDIVC